MAPPPQSLYQAPPGAQQLSLPDFLNLPHFRHVTALPVVMNIVLALAGVVIDARIISSRSGIGRRDTCFRVDRGRRDAYFRVDRDTRSCVARGRFDAYFRVDCDKY